MLLSAAIFTAMVAGTPAIKDMPISCPALRQPAKASDIGNRKAHRTRKLSPNEERAAQLLRGVEAEAEAAEPAMQTYLLMRLGRLWRECSGDPKQALPMISRALEASKEVDDEQRLKTSLQVSITRFLPPEELLKVLPVLTEDARSELLPSLAQIFAQKKQYDKAVEIFDQFADAKQFPYSHAGAVVRLLPESAGIERRRIFTAAMQWARGNADVAQPGLYDLGSLVVDCWRYLPESQVNEAIDLLLDQARQELTPAETSVVIGKNQMQFRSTYEYRLFQLLPVIKQLDKSKAELLMDKEPGIRVAFEKYPDGMKSVEGNGIEDRTVTVGAEQEMYSRIAAFRGQINSLMRAGKFREALDQTLAWAATLDEKGYSIEAFLNIASFVGTRDKDIAQEALQDAEASLPDVNGKQYADEAIRLCEAWTQLESPERCDRLLPKAAKQLEVGMSEEKSSKEPNLAFKGYRPSLFALEGVAYFTCKRKPEEVEDLENSVGDAETKTILRLTQARCFLGLNREYWSPQVMRDSKEKMWSSF